MPRELYPRKKSAALAREERLQLQRAAASLHPQKERTRQSLRAFVPFNVVFFSPRLFHERLHSAREETYRIDIKSLVYESLDPIKLAPPNSSSSLPSASEIDECKTLAERQQTVLEVHCVCQTSKAFDTREAEQRIHHLLRFLP